MYLFIYKLLTLFLKIWRICLLRLNRCTVGSNLHFSFISGSFKYWIKMQNPGCIKF